MISGVNSTADTVDVVGVSVGIVVSFGVLVVFFVGNSYCLAVGGD